MYSERAKALTAQKMKLLREAAPGTPSENRTEEDWKFLEEQFLEFHSLLDKPEAEAKAELKKLLERGRQHKAQLAQK
jgi:hypothetical protein